LSFVQRERKKKTKFERMLLKSSSWTDIADG